MIQNQIQPFASNIWEWGKTQTGANLITVDKEQIVLTLLPRTTGKFSRFGLRVNKMRYKHENFTEKYLAGGEVTVAYNPEDVSYIWLIEENGTYVKFELILKIEILKLMVKYCLIISIFSFFCFFALFA